jgi:hypothetical protein
MYWMTLIFVPACNSPPEKSPRELDPELPLLISRVAEIKSPKSVALPEVDKFT